jgi:hypothetical protein
MRRAPGHLFQGPAPELAPTQSRGLRRFDASGVSDGDRTRDNWSHNPVLYH